LAYAPFWFAEAQITNIGPSGFIFNHLFFYNHSIPSGLKKNAEGMK
jgi:hypothetical protein